ncbi:uncharacterized protein LOC144906924 [Branchiostoma floridae x Branchiostoma belcheri]
MFKGELHGKGTNMSTSVFHFGGQLTGAHQLDRESLSPEGSIQLISPSSLSRAGATALLTVAITVPTLGFLYLMCRCSWRRCRRWFWPDEAEEGAKAGDESVMPEIVVLSPTPRLANGTTRNVAQKKMNTKNESAMFPASPARLHRTVSTPSPGPTGSGSRDREGTAAILESKLHRSLSDPALASNTRAVAATSKEPVANPLRADKLI